MSIMSGIPDVAGRAGVFPADGLLWTHVTLTDTTRLSQLAEKRIALSTYIVSYDVEGRRSMASVMNLKTNMAQKATAPIPANTYQM